MTETPALPEAPKEAPKSSAPFDLVNTQDPEGPALKITQTACDRLRILFAEEKAEHPASTPVLSIRVDAGGCSGFQYRLEIIRQPDPEDVLLSYQDIQVAIDAPSLELLNGSHLDFAQELMGAAFVIRNPNAASSCGCGNSFSPF